MANSEQDRIFKAGEDCQPSWRNADANFSSEGTIFIY